MPNAAQPNAVVMALDDANEALRQLDSICCEPGRSPRMTALAQTLDVVRRNVGDAGSNPQAAEIALDGLEDAGAQIGRLQIGCCAPDRLPLYAKMLQRLTEAQLDINRSLGRGH